MNNNHLAAFIRSEITMARNRVVTLENQLASLNSGSRPGPKRKAAATTATAAASKRSKAASPSSYVRVKEVKENDSSSDSGNSSDDDPVKEAPKPKAAPKSAPKSAAPTATAAAPTATAAATCPNCKESVADSTKLITCQSCNFTECGCQGNTNKCFCCKTAVACDDCEHKIFTWCGHCSNNAINAEERFCSKCVPWRTSNAPFICGHCGDEHLFESEGGGIYCEGCIEDVRNWGEPPDMY